MWTLVDRSRSLPSPPFSSIFTFRSAIQNLATVPHGLDLLPLCSLSRSHSPPILLTAAPRGHVRHGRRVGLMLLCLLASMPPCVGVIAITFTSSCSVSHACSPKPNVAGALPSPCYMAFRATSGYASRAPCCCAYLCGGPWVCSSLLP